MADQGGFPHHMIKEIFEQPRAIHDTIVPRVSLGEAAVQLREVHINPEELRALRRNNIVASGTSRHPGMAEQDMIVELAELQVDADYASELEYSTPLILPCQLTI